MPIATIYTRNRCTNLHQPFLSDYRSLYAVTISHLQIDLSQKGTLMTNSYSSPTITKSSNCAPPDTPFPSSSTNSTPLNNQHHFANVSSSGNIATAFQEFMSPPSNIQPTLISSKNSPTPDNDSHSVKLSPSGNIQLVLIPSKNMSTPSNIQLASTNCAPPTNQCHPIINCAPPNTFHQSSITRQNSTSLDTQFYQNENFAPPSPAQLPSLITKKLDTPRYPMSSP